MSASGAKKTAIVAGASSGLGLYTAKALVERGDYFVPEMLIAGKAMSGALYILRPLLAQTGAETVGTYVMGTVKGDVHDIGKNLVDIILTNNGYNVINVGIKQPINDIIAAAEQHNADVIGMSGLLVKSTLVMK